MNKQTKAKRQKHETKMSRSRYAAKGRQQKTEGRESYVHEEQDAANAKSMMQDADEKSLPRPNTNVCVSCLRQSVKSGDSRGRK